MSWIFFCELGNPDSPTYFPVFVLIGARAPVTAAVPSLDPAKVNVGTSAYPNPGSLIVTSVTCPPKGVPTVRTAFFPK